MSAAVVLAACGASKKSAGPDVSMGGSGGMVAGTGGAPPLPAGTAGSLSADGGRSAGAGGSASGAGNSSTAGSGGATDTAGRGGNAGSSDFGGAGSDAGGEGGRGHEEPGPVVPPSCADFAGTECHGDDCCASPAVPGGVVLVEETEHTLRSFRLDKYEVTVARFRNYMNVVDAWTAAGNPVEGSGAHPDVPESGFRTSWIDQLDDWLADGLVPGWRGNTADGIYGGNPNYLIEGTERLAVNHVPFHIAFAFCIWDGGRLPSMVEWLRAAQGGDAHTEYPWGDAPTPEEMFADRPTATVPTPYDDPFWQHIGIPVGSHPPSAGQFGHHDLAAGLSEYLRDSTPPSVALTSQALIDLTDDQELDDDNRMTATVNWAAPGVMSTYGMTGVGSGTIGFRCARDLPAAN